MTMIEKVAQAIADNIVAALPAGVEIDTRYAAIAAIEAMMEPTDNMLSLDIADRLEQDLDNGLPVDSLSTAYKAMVSAALEGK